MKIKNNIIISKEREWYIAKCLENNVASQGKTKEEALDNLKEALELYNQQLANLIKYGKIVRYDKFIPF